MEITPYLPDLFKLSPIVGILCLILFVFWNYFKNKESLTQAQMDKKDQAILTLMTDHSEKLLSVQEKNITGLNDVANSNVQLANALDKLNGTIQANQTVLLDELDEIRQGQQKIRPLNNRKTTPAEVSEPVAKA